jgi:hypothetical protein
VLVSDGESEAVVVNLMGYIQPRQFSNVMAVEDTEAVFVNIIGNISPAELERVMDNFDVNINGVGNGNGKGETDE